MKCRKNTKFRRNINLFTLISIVFFYIFLVGNAYAIRSVTFTWMVNDDSPAVDGYRLYYKIGDPVQNSDFTVARNDYDGTDASGANPSPIEIPGQATGQYVLENLFEGQKYSFVLTAFRGEEESQPTAPKTLEAISEKIPPELNLIIEKK